MKKIILTAVAATMFAAPAMAQPPAHAPAHGWRAKQGYAQGYQSPRYYNDRGYYDDGRAYYGGRAYYRTFCNESKTGGNVFWLVVGVHSSNMGATLGATTLRILVDA